MKKKFFSFFLFPFPFLFLFGFFETILADQYLPNQLENDQTIQESLKNIKTTNNDSELEDIYKKYDSSDDFVNPGDKNRKNIQENLSNPSNPMNEEGLVDTEKVAPKEYMEINLSDQAIDRQKLTKKKFGFVVYKDRYQYHNQSDNFHSLFREGPYKEPFILLLSSKYLLGRFLLEWFVGGNLGVGYNQGKGRFVNGTLSDATITLLTIPVDFNLTTELPIFSWFKLSFEGGPSMMVMNQNRSDVAEGSSKENTYQKSFGYYYSYGFQFDLTRLFPSAGQTAFRGYSVTRILVSLNSRWQKYDKFKSNSLSVDGNSYGVGFSFEFM